MQMDFIYYSTQILLPFYKFLKYFYFPKILVIFYNGDVVSWVIKK